MTYHELLELYKTGKLGEEQARKVAADIEKQDAISEFLYEEESVPEVDGIFENEEPEKKDHADEEHFLKMIQRSIRQAFLKLGAGVLVVLLVIILLVQFVLPKVVSCFYYDPSASNGEYETQLGLDLSVYAELFLPDLLPHRVSAESKGYGCYDIHLAQTMSMNDHFNITDGKIERGKLTLYDPSLLNRPTGNIFAWTQTSADTSKSLTEQAALENTDAFREKYTEDDSDTFVQIIHASAGDPEQATEALKELNPYEMYVAYVSLDCIMSYEEFMDFLGEDCEFPHIWCAVLTDQQDQSEDNLCIRNIGFYCDLTQSTNLEWDRERYPGLFVWPEDDTIEDLEDRLKDEDYMVTHFTSLLRYLADQDQFLEMMDTSGYCPESAEDCRAIADYVEKNGLQVYGFAAVMDKETALKLNQREEVYLIDTETLR